MQVSRVRVECDQKVFELGRKNAAVIEKYQEDFDVMKEEKEGMINRIRKCLADVVICSVDDDAEGIINIFRIRSWDCIYCVNAH